MTGIKRKTTSVAQQIADVLREELIGLQPNTYIGSEESLIARFGTSRPTMQQATRILSHEKLLVMRRGVRGGAYSTRPPIEMVVQAVSIYLRVEGTTKRDISEPSPALGRDAIRLACKSNDEAVRNELRLFLASERKKKASTTGDDRSDVVDRKFGELIGRLCGNSVIRLLLAVLFELGAWHLDLVMHRTDARLIEIRQTRIDLAAAIIARDTAIAIAYWDKYITNTVRWHEEDLGEEIMTRRI